MKRIWAPWRLEYIQSKKKPGCIFCRALKSRNDQKNYLLYRAKHSFIILNTYPYNNGHLMVVPNRHKSSLSLLNDKELCEVMQLIKKSQDLLKKCIKPEGYNIGLNEGRSAGAGVAGHIHFHIVPRWRGDFNFMPLIANTKVIPDALDSFYKKLKSKL